MTMPDGTPVRFRLRRSRQARRLSMKLNPDRVLVVVAPPRASLKQVEGFITRHAGWVQQQMMKLHQVVALQPGALFSLLGQEVTLAHTPDMRHHALHDGVLHIGGQERQFNTRLKHYLYALARQTIVQEADRASQHIGAPYQAVALRDTISRWGSCSRHGNLSFSWRLVFAPRAVLEYVVCHEIAHLRHMDHSPRFWGLVAELMPDYDAHRQWLTAHGHTLHRYQIGR